MGKIERAIREAIRLFPDFDPSWSLGKQKAWFDAFCGLVKLISLRKRGESLHSPRSFFKKFSN